jgi:hypothetical protein
VTFDAYHLPGFDAAGEPVVLESNAVRAVVPRLSPDDVRAVCQALRAARTQLARFPVGRIIAAVDAAARRLRDPASDRYPELIAGIGAFSGYSTPMAEYVLERMSADWLAGPLHQLVRAELGGAAAIDGFAPAGTGVRSRAVAPPLTFHVFAGNVPGVSVTSIIRALLVKSAVFGKTAAAEPLLAPHFARLLARADPAIGAAVAVTCWVGGDTALEQAALEHADTVIHYGGAAAIESLRARTPAGVRFVEHGPRVSFAIVNGEIVAGEPGARAARDLARAVAVFDQQGCVSPQIAYVVGGDDDAPRRLAALVASALEQLQQELPRGRIDPAEAAAIRDLRTRTEFRSIAGEPVQLWAGQPLTWTVVLAPGSDFAGTCLNRSLLVRPARSLHDVIAHLRPAGHLLQTLGVAGFHGERLLDLAVAAADAGVTRIARLADMPWPPPTWHHDGNSALAELVRWVDLEIDSDDAVVDPPATPI